MSGKTEKKSPEGALTLSTGLELTFGYLTAGDLIDAVAELGCSLEEAPAFKSSMVLTWRSAVRGGYKGSFREFVDALPMAEVQEVAEAAAPFLAARSG